MRLQRAWPVFFELLDDMGVLRRMLRTRADVAEAELVQQLSDIAGVVVHVEAFLDDALQVDAPPAHDAVNGGVRTLLDDCGQVGLLLGRQPRWWSRRPLIEKTIGAGRVEPVNPVAQRLAVHAANPRGIGSVHPFPSRTAAIEKSRLLWRTSFATRARRRSSTAEKSSRNFTADPIAESPSATGNHATQTSQNHKRVRRRDDWYQFVALNISHQFVTLVICDFHRLLPVCSYYVLVS